MLTELKFSGGKKKTRGLLSQITAHEKALKDLVATVLVQRLGRNRGLSLFSSQMARGRIETRYPNSALVVNFPLSKRKKRCFIMTMGSQLKGNMAVAAKSRDLQS